jgi:hypothetical protein
MILPLTLPLRNVPNKVEKAGMAAGIKAAEEGTLQ